MPSRSLCRNAHRSSTEEDDSSSEEEMEWTDNSLLFANLSIPQYFICDIFVLCLSDYNLSLSDYNLNDYILWFFFI